MMRNSRAIFGLLASISMYPAVALAQEAPAGQDESTDIVVTAQRREERLSEIPISITSASDLVLQRAQVNTALDLPRITPGLQVARNGLQTNAAIRGVTSRVGENSIPIYLDGVYSPSVVTSVADLSDVERVDVLKGPQGTLFGRNATGGAILIKTYDPSQQFALRITGGAEERNGYRGSGFVNAPLTDNLAFTASATYSKSDGWLRQGVNRDPAYTQTLAAGTPLNPTERSNQRLKLLWTPDDTLDVLLSLENGYQSDPGSLAWVAVRNTAFGSIQPLPRNVGINSKVAESTARWLTGSLKITKEAGDWTLQSLTSYRREVGDVDVSATQNAGPAIPATWHTVDKTFAQEFTANGKLGAIDVVLGAFIYQDTFYKDYTSVAVVNEQKALALAPFADVTWNVTDRLQLIGGLRFTYEQRKWWYRDANTTRFDVKKDYTDLSPRAVVKYKVDDASNIYASYSKGFKSGLYNVDAAGIDAPTDLAAQALEPESLNAFEVGYKRSAGGIDLSLAGYYYDWKNIQVNLYTNGNTINQNAAAAEIYGVEAQLSWRVSSNLSISANGAYTHGRFTSFPDAAVQITAPTAGGFLSASDTTSALFTASAQNQTGQRLPRTPDWTGSLAINYRIPTSIGDFEISPNVYVFSNYANQVLLDTNRKNVLDLGSHAITSLNVTYKPSDNLTLTLYARNLTDEAYFSEKDYNALGIFGMWVEPQTFGFKLGFTY